MLYTLERRILELPFSRVRIGWAGRIDSSRGPLDTDRGIISALQDQHGPRKFSVVVAAVAVSLSNASRYQVSFQLGLKVICGGSCLELVDEELIAVQSCRGTVATTQSLCKQRDRRL